MRKIKRSMIRANAKAEKTKPSRWVKVVWEQFGQKRYGVSERKFNQARGTHKRHLWGSRVAMYASAK